MENMMTYIFWLDTASHRVKVNHVSSEAATVSGRKKQEREVQSEIILHVPAYSWKEPR
jgi:uncharacterized membrane protein